MDTDPRPTMQTLIQAYYIAWLAPTNSGSGDQHQVDPKDIGQLLRI
jgi:hypothetical protein